MLKETPNMPSQTYGLGSAKMTVQMLLSFVLICQLLNLVHPLSPSMHEYRYRSLGSYFLPTTCDENNTYGRYRSVVSISMCNKNKNIGGKTARFRVTKFFNRSGRQKIGGDNTSKENLGYVPSGLSREEYSAIRKSEREREKKMNYAAWGPRFRRTGRPDGDWMVMPNLWTMGQIEFKRNSEGGNDENFKHNNIGSRIRSLIQTYGTASFLAYVLVDSLYLGYALWKYKQIQDLGIVRKSYGLAYGVYRLLSIMFGTHLIAAMNAVKSPIIGSSMFAFTKIILFKTAAVILQVPLWNNLMERVNRRWLWSKTRIAVTFTLATIASFALFGITFLQ